MSSTLYSPNCSSLVYYSRLATSSSSPSGCQQRITVSSLPKLFHKKDLSLQSPRNQRCKVVRMHEGEVDVTASLPGNDTPVTRFKDELLKIESSEECKDAAGFDFKEESTVSITVVGASGDLAKKKIFPALFALYYEDCLPKHFTVFGYARSKMTDEELRNMVSKTLTCRIDKRENCSEKMDQFLKRCFYHSGQYDSDENFAELDKELKEHEVMPVWFR